MISGYSEHRHAKQPSPSSRRRKNKSRRPQLQYQGSWDRKDFSALVISTPDDDSMQFSSGIRLLTYDFVVRSLRRRLWKAFREEDVATATRAYQATLPDFVRWLEEEKQEQRNREREYDALRSKTKSRDRSASPVNSRSRSPSLRHPRRSSFDQASFEYARNRAPRRGKRPGRRMASRERDRKLYEEKNSYRLELLNHEYQQRMETESMIGGPDVAILQSRMNPSEPFIADDYLCPYDDLTYDNPAQKTLPDPVQHAAEQKALAAERKRQRKLKSPRMAFRRMITGRRTNSTSIDDHDDFELVNSMIVDANTNAYFSPEFGSGALGNSTEEEDPLMTTPLHEAARIGAGDFVRLLLADGGNANTKNGDLRTAIHMCAGGITVKEQKIMEAIATVAAERSRATAQEEIVPDKKKKKRYLKTNKQKAPPASAIEHTPTTTPTPTLGIQPTVIPKECLELMRQLDLDPSETTKDKKKSNSKRRLFGKIFSPKKDKSNHNSSLTDKDLDLSFNTYGSFGSSELLSNHMNPHTPFIADAERLNDIITDRLDAMLALLAFVHKESGEGPSINAVDHNGRTSLHYAAELGRLDICTAMLSHFGIILTIVDEAGTRTPCEVAAHQGHTELAALLGARALLYIDPYGLDDEMMDMIKAANEGANGNGSSMYKRSNPNGRLVPPYRWFINLSKEEIAHERVKQLEEAREKLIQVFLEPPTPTETEEDIRQSAAEAIRNNCLFGPRRANLEPYVVETSESDRQHLKPPPSNNQETIDNYDDKKPQPSDIQGAKIDDDGQEKLPSLQNSHVELYMTHHNWDLPAALDAFRQNRKQAFATAGIHNFFEEEKKEAGLELEATACLCPICYDGDIEKQDWIVLQCCGHGFCRDCLVDYFKQCAIDRKPAHLLTCPDHNCNSAISNLDLQAILGDDHPEIIDRISKASTDNFITSHTNFRFCPHPGCSGIVHRFRQPKWASADYDESILNYTGAVCTAVTPSSEKIGNECTLTYEGVEDPNYTNCRSLRQPMKAHRFCFSCGDAVHWPLTCERLEEWKKHISIEIGKVDDGEGRSDFNELAQKIWLKANTRPCPKCKIPIEKNDGCNHMVCHSCHHEFCWICRQDWKLHSTDTGGFFRCNIWREDDSDRIEDLEDGGDPSAARMNSNNFMMDSLNDSGYGTSVHTTRRAWKKKQDIKRFLHHYSRWEAHKDSHILEQKMGDTVCTRFAPVVKAAIQFDGSPTFNFGGKGLSFIHNAFFELEECRSTLRHSYAFSFFRYASKSTPSPISYLGNKRKEKFRFERLQSELETLTEQMSDIVARSHIRASQIQITYLTAGAAEKRLELNNFLFQIFREEKREALRQKNRESERSSEDDKRKQPTRLVWGNELSSNVEMFNRLMQIRDNRYDVSTTPPLAMGDLPSNARDLSMQLMAQDQRLLALGEQLRGMEGMLRRQAQMRTTNNDNEGPRFVYYPNDDDDDEEDTRDQSDNGPATDMWDCALCTYMNTGGSFCAMCETRRP